MKSKASSAASAKAKSRRSARVGRSSTSQRPGSRASSRISNSENVPVSYSRRSEGASIDGKDARVRPWKLVRRPPAPGVGFLIPTWVPEDELSLEERGKEFKSDAAAINDVGVQQHQHSSNSLEAPNTTVSSNDEISSDNDASYRTSQARVSFDILPPHAAPSTNDVLEIGGKTAHNAPSTDSLERSGDMAADQTFMSFETDPDHETIDADPLRDFAEESNAGSGINITTNEDHATTGEATSLSLMETANIMPSSDFFDGSDDPAVGDELTKWLSS